MINFQDTRLTWRHSQFIWDKTLWKLYWYSLILKNMELHCDNYVQYTSLQVRTLWTKGALWSFLVKKTKYIRCYTSHISYIVDVFTKHKHQLSMACRREETPAGNCRKKWSLTQRVCSLVSWEWHELLFQSWSILLTVMKPYQPYC